MLDHTACKYQSQDLTVRSLGAELVFLTSSLLSIYSGSRIVLEASYLSHLSLINLWEVNIIGFRGFIGLASKKKI